MVEMIVAAVLSSVVLMGMFSLMTSMVQTEVSDMRNGTVAAWSLVGVNKMNADISAAGYLAWPTSGLTDDSVIVCTNWSQSAGPGGVPGPVVSNTGNVVSYYCYDAADHTIRHKTQSHANGAEACSAAVPSCDGVGYPGDSVVVTGVYKAGPVGAPLPVFSANTNVQNAVRAQFFVGNPNPGVSQGGNGHTAVVVPQTYAFNTLNTLEISSFHIAAGPATAPTTAPTTVPTTVPTGGTTAATTTTPTTTTSAISTILTTTSTVATTTVASTTVASTTAASTTVRTTTTVGSTVATTSVATTTVAPCGAGPINVGQIHACSGRTSYNWYYYYCTGACAGTYACCGSSTSDSCNYNGPTNWGACQINNNCVTNGCP